MFAIELQPHREGADGGSGPAEASGRIVIGEFTETFKVPLGFWDVSDYRRSWRQAIHMSG